jgi:hypothetical protein
MNALGKIIHYIPKHSLNLGLLQTINLLKRLLMLVLGYMTIFTVLEVLIFHGGKKHTSIHSSDFKQWTKPIFVCFNGLYVYQNNKFRSYLVDGIWKRRSSNILQ